MHDEGWVAISLIDDDPRRVASAPHHPIGMGPCPGTGAARFSQIGRCTPPSNRERAPRRARPLAPQAIVCSKGATDGITGLSWGGWIVFAGFVLVDRRCDRYAPGLVAVFKDEYIVATPRGLPSWT